jgi:hypothetical protein
MDFLSRTDRITQDAAVGNGHDLSRRVICRGVGEVTSRARSDRC